MKLNSHPIADLLTRCFDAIVRNPYHLQVPTQVKGRHHDIWFTDVGVFKYRSPDAAFKEKAQIVSPKEIIRIIRYFQDRYEGIVDLVNVKGGS